jgi:hypothetical protein
MTENEKLIKALADADWSGVPISNKALIAKAVQVLEGYQPAAIGKQEAVAEVVMEPFDTWPRLKFVSVESMRNVEAGDMLYAAPLANEASKPAAQTLSDGAQFFACYLIDNCENEVVREESVQAWLGKMLASPRYHPAAPSVEQDDRGALIRAFDASLSGVPRYVIDRFGVEHVADGGGWIKEGDLFDRFAASTSANVAQGAEAVATVKVYETYTGQDGWIEVTQEEYDRTKDKYEHRIRRVPAPPAQTALTDDGECRSCVNGKCVTGDECVILGRDGRDASASANVRPSVEHDDRAILEEAAVLCFEMSQKYPMETMGALQEAAGIIRTRLRKGSLKVALEYIEHGRLTTAPAAQPGQSANVSWIDLYDDLVKAGINDPTARAIAAKYASAKASEKL